MMKIASIMATIVAIMLPNIISAECECLASGDPHYVMCDKQTKFDLQAEGLFTAFKSQDLEIQVFQKMAVGKPYAIVDYCSIKYVKDYCTFVMKSRSIDAWNDVVINGQKMPVTSASTFLEKEIDKSLGITIDKNFNMIFNTKDGIVQVACQPWEFLIRAPNTKKCEGLCGDCSGKPQTKPSKPLQLASKEVHQYAGSCKPKPPTAKPTTAPTPKPTNATMPPTTMPTTAPVANVTNVTTPAPTTATPAPTTAIPTTAPIVNVTTPPTVAPTTAPVVNATAAPTTAPVVNATAAPTTAPVVNATAAPTTAPVVNATTMPTPAPANNATNETMAPTPAPVSNVSNSSLVPPPVKECEKAKVVGHPVFESEEVMHKVINACLCGQPKERMDHDKVFGGFVENCIYDKSLGPDDENVAAANMETFLKVLTPIPELVIQGDNITAVPAPDQPQATVIGNISYSNMNFDTSAILEKHVTKFPTEISPTAGVSYRLRYIVPDDDVALLPELMPRAKVFTGAGERSEPIPVTPAQQMVLAQNGMHSMPVSTPMSSPNPMSLPSPPVSIDMPGQVKPIQPLSSPVSYLAPNNDPMPARPPVPMRPQNERVPLSSNGNDDDKLKVHFDLEAPIIISPKN